LDGVVELGLESAQTHFDGSQLILQTLVLLHEEGLQGRSLGRLLILVLPVVIVHGALSWCAHSRLGGKLDGL